MRSPPSFSPRRPFGPSRRTPPTGPGCAVALVRVEFERARHARELERLRLREAASLRALDTLDARARALCAAIAGRAGDA